LTKINLLTLPHLYPFHKNGIISKQTTYSEEPSHFDGLFLFSERLGFLVLSTVSSPGGSESSLVFSSHSSSSASA